MKNMLISDSGTAEIIRQQTPVRIIYAETMLNTFFLGLNWGLFKLITSIVPFINADGRFDQIGDGMLNSFRNIFVSLIIIYVLADILALGIVLYNRGQSVELRIFSWSVAMCMSDLSFSFFSMVFLPQKSRILLCAVYIIESLLVVILWLYLKRSNISHEKVVHRGLRTLLPFAGIAGFLEIAIVQLGYSRWYASILLAIFPISAMALRWFATTLLLQSAEGVQYAFTNSETMRNRLKLPKAEFYGVLSKRTSS